MSVRIFGIRHHGPGSARSLVHALHEYAPDCVLIEGPPDANDILRLASHPDMEPPVALLLYAVDSPQLAAYYPFATFSPEWQAARFGLSKNVPVEFIDLPASHHLAIRELTERPTPQDGTDADSGETEIVPGTAEEHRTAEAEEPSRASQEGEEPPSVQPDPEAGEIAQQDVRADPILFLARAAGYDDGERWWEMMVEQRSESRDIFPAITEMMEALREEFPETTLPLDLQREAYMRGQIRAALRRGCERVAVVCGAWHAPALETMPTAAHDTALLKGLPKIKVSATWVPWTQGRLGRSSSYGAGVDSPGWYEHLWTYREKIAEHWVARIARLLRDQDLDASSASVIETVRLAEALAAMRDRHLPGLDELGEATLSVLCHGNPAPMNLIVEQLIVGERLGAVPEDAPTVPLAQDLARQQKRLRLSPEASARSITLDLRKPNDLDRSRLLHRLRLLGINWGIRETTGGKKGTFAEPWSLQWRPELSIALIEAGIHGNTIHDAAAASALATAERTDNIESLTQLLDAVLLADLPEVVERTMARLQATSARTGNIAHLMGALPPLASILRYGNVRRTDSDAVSTLVDELVSRICIGLPLACAMLADDAARTMLGLIDATNAVIGLLDDETHRKAWQDTLLRLQGRTDLNGLLAGRCNRILLDCGEVPPEEIRRIVGLALSANGDSARAAAWIEGFLGSSGLLLLHDRRLWSILDDWVAGLRGDTFIELLPLLRRTFSTFPAPERRQIGERLVAIHSTASGNDGVDELDVDRAATVLPLLGRLLGVDYEQPSGERS